MKKSSILFAVSLSLLLVVTACQKTPTSETAKPVLPPQASPPSAFDNVRTDKLRGERQAEKPPELAAQAGPPAEETVPLITEVMSKEEQEAYLKENGVPVLTKENFREPELLWERKFGEPVLTVDGVRFHGVTDKGNSIVAIGNNESPKVVFLDIKGNLRKVIDVKKSGMSFFRIAPSGKAVVMGNWSGKTRTLSLAYFEEEGIQAWRREFKVDSPWVTISENGDSIGIQERNQEWTSEEFEGGDVNVAAVIILNRLGKAVFEIKAIRNMAVGKFSADGRYFAGVFWWMTGDDVTGKLIYVDTWEKRILWQKVVGGGLGGEAIFGEYQLAVSENGSYVAAANMDSTPDGVSGGNKNDVKVTIIFNRQGRKVARVPGGDAYRITESGLFSGTSGDWVDISRKMRLGFSGEEKYCFIRYEVGSAWDKGVSHGQITSFKILSREGATLWQNPATVPPWGEHRIVANGKYLSWATSEQVFLFRFFLPPSAPKRRR